MLYHGAMTLERRYQVFVSSTFDDLKAEREEVLKALLEARCIPAGMELFPASNDEQWSLIKRVIDECDYFIVIVGNRYGTIAKPRKMSYTEAEYRYALSKKKYVMAFVHEHPEKMAVDRSESSPAGKRKLAEFRNLVKKRSYRLWTSADNLASQVSRSLNHAITIGQPSAGFAVTLSLLTRWCSRSRHCGRRCSASVLNSNERP
jgi:GTPase SAR1 family protein